jgi:hypothetical protein
VTKFVFQGTGRTTGGGDGWKALAALGAIVLIGSSGAGAAIAGTLEAAVIAAAAVVGALILAAALLLALWLVKVRPACDAKAAEERAAQVLAYEEARRRDALERHQRALELAAASAPVIQNVIDPAALVAALSVRPVPVVPREVGR